LYVDGELVGPMETGLNRMDVYEAEQMIDTPNVGFRFNLDYRAYPVGHHLIEVVAQVVGTTYLVANSEFVVVARDQSIPPPLRSMQPNGFKDAKELDGLRYWLDMPKRLQDVYYNPLAKDWDNYRAYQVNQFMAKFYDVALKAGLPASKLYSHQIVPEANSTWNPHLFESHLTLCKGIPWHAGLNMYGGVTNSAWMRNFIRAHQLNDYGSPEFNPQQWKKPGAALDALTAQYIDGARFVSPYFISISPQRFKFSDSSVLNGMELRPGNKKYGSDQFFRAIQEFAAN
jgi:hypothetical protein